MQFLLIFALSLAAESVVVKSGGEGEKKQQKRGNVEISSGGLSGSTGFSLGSAGELDSSEKYIYGRHGIDLGLILGNIGHGSTGLSSARGLLSSGGYGLGGYDLGSHLTSGGHDNGFSSGKVILLSSRGLGHGSGLDGIGVGSGLFGGAGFYGDISGKGSGPGQVQVTTVTQPQPVPVIVSRPVPVSVPAPYPVQVPRLVPVSVVRPYPVTVSRPALTRPYAVAVPQPVHVQVPQQVTVAVPVPQPVLVPSVSDSGVEGLGSSAGGGYSTGSSHVGALALPSGGGYTYQSSYGSPAFGLAHLSTPLKGVYVPSYLGGLHGSSAGTSGGSAVYAGSPSAGSGYGSYNKN